MLPATYFLDKRASIYYLYYKQSTMYKSQMMKKIERRRHAYSYLLQKRIEYVISKGTQGLRGKEREKKF